MADFPSEDRISKLPDSLLIDQIISRLPNTKSAITSGILSKRWKYLWQSVPFIRFDDFSFSKSTTNGVMSLDFNEKACREFYEVVAKVLSQLKLDSINKFELEANYHNRFAFYVNNWIEFIVSKNVKQFKLYLMDLEEDDNFIIQSESFYRNSHFSDIDVGFCLLHPTVSISWINLTDLSLSHTKLGEKLIPNVVSGSPLLRSLTLQSCSGELIDIRSNSLKNLVLDGYESDDDGNSVVINAPNICSLIIVGNLWITNIVLDDVSSLVKAELDYQVPCYFSNLRKKREEQVLNGLMLNLQHLKELNIGICCFPTLRRLVNKGFTIPSNLISVGFKDNSMNSPYKFTETDMNSSLTKLEFNISGSVFLMQKDPSEIVFETKSGIILNRAHCESLGPSFHVDDNVINIWSVILNEEQEFHGGVITKLYMQTSIVSSDMWDGSLNFEEAYEIFESNMNMQLLENVQLLSMKDIKTVFFPVVSVDKYYLVVFDIKNTCFSIIDNCASCNDYALKYQPVCDVLHRLFCQHLIRFGHSKASAIKNLTPSVLYMSWSTLNNEVDSGVFLMCHMDTYIGQSVSSWDPGFVDELSNGKITQKGQLNKLRAKYCTKILLHHSNIHKGKMISYAKEFGEMYDFPEDEKTIEEPISLHFEVVRV